MAQSVNILKLGKTTLKFGLSERFQNIGKIKKFNYGVLTRVIVYPLCANFHDSL